MDPPPAARVSLVSTTLTAWSGMDDWLEFSIDVVRD